MSNKKVSELEEASAANEYDYLMIIQNGVNKKIQASKIGTGQSGSGGDTLPIGAILPFSGDIIPNGWLLCDGSVIEQEDYPELFEVLAGNYGIISREEIRLPDLRGKVTIGKDSTDADFDTLGNTGGEKTHNLTIDEMPSHNHEVYLDNQGTGGKWGPLGTVQQTTEVYTTTNNVGNNQPHNNLQPYIVTNYIIKAKMTIVTNGEVIQENDTATTENVYSASAVDNKLAQIIQSGSNANGSYIKYSDGTMICYGSTSLNEVSVSDYYSFCKRTNSLTITFPMEFDEVPNVTITNQGFEIFSYTINNITANNFSYYAFTYPSGSNISGSLQYVAIGRWK